MISEDELANMRLMAGAAVIELGKRGITVSYEESPDSHAGEPKFIITTPPKELRVVRAEGLIPYLRGMQDALTQLGV